MSKFVLSQVVGQNGCYLPHPCSIPCKQHDGEKYCCHFLGAYEYCCIDPYTHPWAKKEDNFPLKVNNSNEKKKPWKLELMGRNELSFIYCEREIWWTKERRNTYILLTNHVKKVGNHV